jgi:GT2 family glycosyltransferase
MSRLTAVVVAYDSAHVLPACLEALKGEGVPTIVVDNASEDDTADLAERHGARVLRNAANEGYGRGNDLGVRVAASEHVLIINPDMVLEAGAAPLLLQAADQYPDAAILAPRIIEPDGRFFFQANSLLSRARRNEKQPLPEGDCCAPFLSGSCLMVRRELFPGAGWLRRSDLPVLRG